MVLSSGDPGRHGGNTYTGTGDQPTLAQYEAIFGPAGRDIKIDSQRHKRHQRWHLPDVLKGPNTYLTDRIDGLITDATNSPFTRNILPYVYLENPDQKLKWNVYSFDEGIASRVPYEAAARVLPQSKQSFSGYVVRQGLAIAMEHNFMVSEKGRENFKHQLTQLVGSIQMTNDLDVHVALLQAPSYQRQIEEKYYDQTRTTSQACRQYTDLFGIMQKHPNALDILIEDAKNHLKTWGSQPPTFLLCNGKLTTQLTMNPERTNYLTNGPDGLQRLAQGPDLPSYRGLSIIHSRKFSLDTGTAPRDLMRRKVRVAEYYHIPWSSEVKDKFFEFYDQSRDTWFRLSWEQLKRMSALPEDGEDGDAHGGNDGIGGGGGGRGYQDFGHGYARRGGALQPDMALAPLHVLPMDSRLGSAKVGGPVNTVEVPAFNLKEQLGTTEMQKLLKQSVCYLQLMVLFTAVQGEAATANKGVVAAQQLLQAKSVDENDQAAIMMKMLLLAMCGYVDTFKQLQIKIVRAGADVMRKLPINVMETGKIYEMIQKKVKLCKGKTTAVSIDDVPLDWDTKTFKDHLTQYLTIAASLVDVDFNTWVDAPMEWVYDNVVHVGAEAAQNSGAQVYHWYDMQSWDAGHVEPVEAVATRVANHSKHPDYSSFLVTPHSRNGNGAGPDPSAGNGDRDDDQGDQYDLFILRPNIEHEMLSVIMGRGGTQELGCTFWGQTELSCYDDAQHGIWGMSYKYHERAMVTNERNLIRVYDVAFDGYNGGMDQTNVDFTDDISRQEFRNATYDRTRPYTGPSMMVMRLPHDPVKSNKTLPNPLVFWPTERVETTNPDCSQAVNDLHKHDVFDFASATDGQADARTPGTHMSVDQKARYNQYIQIMAMNQWQNATDHEKTPGERAISGESSSQLLAFEGTMKIYTKNQMPLEHKQGSGHLGPSYVGVASIREGRGVLNPASAPELRRMI